VDYGEADRICTLLTPDLGKVSALARSARRSRKRYGGALSLFVIGEATLAPPRRGELMLLERFDAVEDLAPAISADVIKVAHGSYVLEVTRELWPPEQPDRPCFDLVCATLRLLAARPPSPSLLRAFELRLLAAVGLAPALDRCVRCEGEAFEGGWFDLGRGGVLCPACGPGGQPLSPEAHRTLQQLAHAPLEQAADLAQGGVAAETRAVMLATVRHHLGKDLRSLQFLLQLARSGPR